MASSMIQLIKTRPPRLSWWSRQTPVHLCVHAPRLPMADTPCPDDNSSCQPVKRAGGYSPIAVSLIYREEHVKSEVGFTLTLQVLWA